MYCRKCGKEIDDSVSFCRFCGTKVGEMNSRVASELPKSQPVNVGTEVIFSLLSLILLGFAIANIVAFFLPIYDGLDLTLMDFLEDENEKVIIPLIASVLSVGLFGVSFNKKGTGVFTLLISVAIAVLDIMWVNDRKGGLFEEADFEEFAEICGMGLKLYIICSIGVPVCGVLKSLMLARTNR